MTHTERSVETLLQLWYRCLHTISESDECAGPGLEGKTLLFPCEQETKERSPLSRTNEMKKDLTEKTPETQKNNWIFVSLWSVISVHFICPATTPDPNKQTHGDVIDGGCRPGSYGSCGARFTSETLADNHGKHLQEIVC